MQSWENTLGIMQNAVFFSFLAISERKGGCYMPEICNQTGSDVLGGTGNIAPKHPGIWSISIFSPIFPPVPPKKWALPPL